MDTEIVLNCKKSENLSDMETNPPHTQQTRMATEVTSAAMRDMCIVTTTEDEDGIPETTIDGASKHTGNSSLDDKKTVNYSNKNCNSIVSSMAVSGCSGGLVGNNINKTKRKHRRGKPKSKNIKPYKKNWKFPMPSRYRTTSASGAVGNNNNNNNRSARIKLARSRSLVPYNTNKFLMEEHLAEVPNALLSPSGRTRESSFSVDSEDNYFHSLTEDEEEFLTKEFANVYEKARIERLESLSKQQLIEECLQIEDRYSAQNIGNQKQQQLRIQKISAEFLSKIRALEEKMRDMNRENADLRKKLNLLPIGGTEAMSSSSEDSESDSSSSSSNSSTCSSGEYSACGSPQQYDENDETDDLRMDADDDNDDNDHRRMNGDAFNVLSNGHAVQMNSRSTSPETHAEDFSQMNGNGHHQNSDSDSSPVYQQQQQQQQPQSPQMNPNE